MAKQKQTKRNEPVPRKIPNVNSQSSKLGLKKGASCPKSDCIELKPVVHIEQCDFSNLLELKTSHKLKLVVNVEQCDLSSHLKRKASSTQPVVRLNRLNSLEFPKSEVNKTNGKTHSGGTSTFRKLSEKQLKNEQINNEFPFQSSSYEKQSESRPNSKEKVLNLQEGAHSNIILKPERVNTGKCLRDRQRVNYKEKLSIGTPENSTITDIEKIHVPIYRRAQFIEAQGKKRKHDQYDFVPDSEEEKDSDPSFFVKSPVRKKKRIFRNRKRLAKDKIESRDKIEKIPNGVGNRSYEDKINCILKKAWSRKMQNHDTQKKNDPKDINITEERMKDSIFNSTQISNKISSFPLPDESVIMLDSGNSDHNVEDSIPKWVENRNLDRKVSLLDGASQVHVNIDDLVEYEGSIGDRSEPHSDCVSPTECSLPDQSNRNSIINLFGFGDENEVVNSDVRRINIIDDVLINTRNSRNEPGGRLQPWRFQADNITRNPHFIKLKKNSMPSVNQDPVVDYTFEERINEVNKTVLLPCTKKSPVQQSILSYIETDKDHTIADYGRKSLYDIEEYSPIKISQSNKENHSENRNVGPRHRTRRRVLGEINDNIRTNGMSTPAKKGQPVPPIRLDLSSIEKNDGIHRSGYLDDFGFDSEVTTDVQMDREHLKTAKPFRLNINAVKPKETVPEKALKPVRDSELGRLLGDEPEFNKLLEEGGLEQEGGKLFEDIEVPQNITRSYRPITKKKHPREHNPKRKDPFERLSKKGQQWVKQFNEICSEVDKWQLEIE